MNLLVTGGCGFIGSNYLHKVANKKQIHKLVNVDCLTYAGSLDNTKDLEWRSNFIHCNVDISNYSDVRDVFYAHDITHVVHFAAESHVDNSISSPLPFIKTNIIGTFNLLEAAREFKVKRFHHVSTDEVYGELGSTGYFTEETPYDPRNPYSATKASSDHLVRAYFHTYNLPCVVSNCCNNYGPRQHREKFIPTVIGSLLEGDKVPVYGDGSNVRDWIYVEDHCAALWKILTRGKPGQTYNVGSNCEQTNMTTLTRICEAMGVSPEDCFDYVEDRAGHDFRYAIDPTKIMNDLRWKPATSFAKGIKKTVKWYEENREFVFE